MNNNPKESAEYFINKYPIRSDSVYIPGIVSHQIDTAMINYNMPSTDINGEIPTFVKCPDVIRIRETITKVDTIVVTKENPAKDEIISQQKIVVSKTSDDLHKYKTKARNRLFTIIILLLINTGYIAYKVSR